MVEICAGETKIRIDFSFFAVITLFLCFDMSGYGLMSIAACFFHECGHLLMTSLRGAMPSAIEFYGGGIKLIGIKSDLAVIISGSLTNFLIAAAVISAADNSSIYPLVFAAVNIIIGLFNLLPIGYLDGKKLIEYILLKNCSPQKAICIIHIIERVMLIAVIGSVIFMFIAGLVNFTVAVMLAYLVLLDVFRVSSLEN